MTWYALIGILQTVRLFHAKLNTHFTRRRYAYFRRRRTTLSCAVKSVLKTAVPRLKLSLLRLQPSYYSWSVLKPNCRRGVVGRSIKLQNCKVYLSLTICRCLASWRRLLAGRVISEKVLRSCFSSSSTTGFPQRAHNLYCG